MTRRKVRFTSADTDCAAWFYPGSNGGCVIMAGGFAVTKEPGTDQFAARFHAAGFSVLAFDYRRIGESGGEPRQLLPLRDQQDDWTAAIDFATTLPGVEQVALWAFSASGGHVIEVAARDQRVAAVIAQTPNADGPMATRRAARYQKPLAMARFLAIVLADTVGGWLGRAPRLVPLVGLPGAVAMLATPDAQEGDRALNAAQYPQWQQEVAARSVFPLTRYRPVRVAGRIECPILVLVCEQDVTALPEPGARVAELAPRGELVRLPGGHYAPFLDQHEQAVAAQLEFLQRALVLQEA